MKEEKILDISQHLKADSSEWSIIGYDYTYALKDKIYVSNVSNSEIVHKCVQRASGTMNASLAGDIQEELRVKDKECLNDIEQELVIHMSRIMQSPVKNVSVELDGAGDLWVNYQKPFEFNPSHSHSGTLSFVIYADISEEIRKEHLNAYGNMHTRGLIQFFSEYTNEHLFLNPVNNNILIFESSHIHQVYPFYSDNTRITIAGNIYGWK